MFQWIKRLFQKRTAGEYTPKERMIFRFYAGEAQGERLADPMALYKKLLDKKTSITIDMKVSQSELKGAPAAHDSLVKTLRETFGLLPLEDGGLTESETIDLFFTFMDYCTAVKKNSSLFPTSPKETSAPSPSTSSEDLPSPSTGDSTSTRGVNGTEPPAPSPSESPSPSSP